MDKHPHKVGNLKSLYDDSQSLADSEDYRKLMKYMATAVHIVTTEGEGGLRGVTISACCSLSDKPPTILICLSRERPANYIFIKNKKFCINSLSNDFMHLADHFAGRYGGSQEERFAQADWTRLKTGAPVLLNALLAFDCQLVCFHEQATHYILIGEVVAMQYNRAKSALLYLNQSYRTLEF